MSVLVKQRRTRQPGRTCSVPGCKNVASGPLCRRHTDGPCVAEGCGNVANGPHGLCRRHQYGICEVDGCERRVQYVRTGRCHQHHLGECSVEGCLNQPSRVGDDGQTLCSMHADRGPDARPLIANTRRDAPHLVYLLYFPSRGAVKVGIAAKESRPTVQVRRHGGVLVHRTGLIFPGEAPARRVEREVLRLWDRMGAQRVPKDGKAVLDDGRSEWRRSADVRALLRVAREVLTREAT